MLRTYRELQQRTSSSRSVLIHRLAELVEIESPTEDPAAINRCVAQVEQWVKKIGGRPRRIRQKLAGDHLVAEFGRERSGKRTGTRPVMVLGHLDTVWPLGTLGKMPFRMHRGRAWGPGVLDMKSGVVMALTALEILRDQLRAPVILLLSSDEETGSEHSRTVIESLARKCSAVFVLEPAQGLSGAYKTARKGVGGFRVQVHGVAAHAGVDFANGHSAVLELSRQIERASGFTEEKRGITVNPGVIAGGTRSNVVAAEAWADFDVRIARAADGPRIERRFRSLRPVDKKCRLEVSGAINRPPMERTKGTVDLFRRAATLASGLGFGLQEAATGGGSDGNFTSALGIPTLDGMGAVGEGAHAVHESILLEALVPRTALLTAMIGGLDLQ